MINAFHFLFSTIRVVQVQIMIDPITLKILRFTEKIRKSKTKDKTTVIFIIGLNF
jgi:hypothetical protein